MLREIDLQKKNTQSDLLSKAPDINNTILINRFKKLKETDEHYNANDNDDDNNNNGGFINPLGPVPSPPNFNDFTQTFQIPQQLFSQPK